MSEQPGKHEPSIEDTVEYLRQTFYARVIAREFRERREAALDDLREAGDERAVWKAVGRIDALSEAAELFAQ